MEQRSIQVHITPGSIISAILFVLLIGLLWTLRDLVLIVLTAIVIASSMEPGVRAFMRWGFNRIFSVAMLYVTVITTFVGTLVFFLPPVFNDAANFVARLPDTLNSLSGHASSLLHGSDISSILSSVDVIRSLGDAFGAGAGGALSTASTFFGGIFSLILVIVFAFYFSVQETGVDDFLEIVTPVRYQERVLKLWKRSQEKIGKWMQGQILLAFLVGVLLYLGLVILGVQHALLLAVVAAFFELIPIFGQIIAGLFAVAAAFATDGVTLALLVGALFLIIQQFESHLIYPLVVKKVVGVPPLLVILALLVGGELAGFVGVLLAVPIAAALREFVTDIEEQHALERKEMARAAHER